MRIQDFSPSTSLLHWTRYIAVSGNSTITCIYVYLQTLRQGGNQGHYMLQYFGDIHESTTAENGSVVLKFKYSDFQNTLVTFHIDASDLTFVYSV